MWYFSWILGLALAASFSIINALWLELAPTVEVAASPREPHAPSP
jgi:cyd operon protein YbgT